MHLVEYMYKRMTPSNESNGNLNVVYMDEMMLLDFIPLVVHRALAVFYTTRVASACSPCLSWCFGSQLRHAVNAKSSYPKSTRVHTQNLQEFIPKFSKSSYPNSPRVHTQNLQEFIPKIYKSSYQNLQEFIPKIYKSSYPKSTGVHTKIYKSSYPKSTRVHTQNLQEFIPNSGRSRISHRGTCTH